MSTNTAPVRYDREELTTVLEEVLGLGAILTITTILDEYEKRRTEGKDKPCQSQAFHGPGHQSSTFCQSTGGEDGHDTDDEGTLIHSAYLPSGGFAEWTDDNPYARIY